MAIAVVTASALGGEGRASFGKVGSMIGGTWLESLDGGAWLDGSWLLGMLQLW